MWLGGIGVAIVLILTLLMPLINWIRHLFK
jgi:hypothetical protein